MRTLLVGSCSVPECTVNCVFVGWAVPVMVCTPSGHLTVPAVTDNYCCNAFSLCINEFGLVTRIAAVAAGGHPTPLLIFPEGTTTNGTTLRGL